MLEAIRREILAFAPPEHIANDNRVETLYLGGGTPSLLNSGELDGLLHTVNNRFELLPDAEITLEANPDDITPEKLESWKQSGINRLSIGIQSFRNEDLYWMNRAHNATQALQSIEWAYAAGFENLNIDLIFGTPTLPDDAWLQNLEQATQSGVTHVSCYALTVEENTALHHFIKKGKVPLPPEERQARQFELLMDWANRSGWEHYEISNLCLPGRRSRHNSNYWTGRPYFGFGPSAHSFDGIATRWMSVANNSLYIETWDRPEGDKYIYERLSKEQRVNEQIMTGLRRTEGIIADPLTATVQGVPLSAKQQQAFFRQLDTFETDGLCLRNGNQITLSPRGRLYADHVAAGLFVD